MSVNFLNHFGVDEQAWGFLIENSD